jgi:hypothetical protein
MRKPYEKTQVTVDKSRSEISKILVAGWKVRGVSWEEDLDLGRTILRFRWRPEGQGPEGELVVRLVLSPQKGRIKSRAKLEAEKEREREVRRLHRVAMWWLKAMSEAVEAGLLTREEVLLPWVETPRGQTVSEMLLPRLADVSGGRLALGAGS